MGKVINNVDVSKCKYYDPSIDNCKAEQGPCKNYSDCYYKQLQNTLKENEDLKLEIDDILDMQE